MDDEEINYRTLRKIQQMEKNSPGLTSLQPDFYISLIKYLNSLEDRFKKETASQKKILLQDEIHNIKKISSNIYEQREKKILLAAVSKARGGNPDAKNLDDIEKKLFDNTLDIMLQTRKQIFGEKNANKSNKTEEKPVGTNNEQTEDAKQNEANPMVIVTQNIPEFVGTDTKKYNLRKGDIISLPIDMTDTLAKRNVVKRIKL
jgi:DNA replication initiation complex subunit (GINS family)